MSQAPHQSTNVLGAGRDVSIDGHPYPHQPKVAQESPNSSDGSGDIFSMYLKMATEDDEKMTENWKADADGILIFTGLFSAAVASLISVSIQDIRQDPQDTSNFYLAHIYQTLADPNRPNNSTALPASPPPFSPPNYAVWVNVLWFLSLVISLTCALLATLLQQWARRYLKVTQPRYALHKRSRIRAFLADGVEKSFLPWTVEALPALLHISLFLFFAGLVVFLSNVNLTIFKFVLSWVGICTALYGCITVTPIFYPNSPYLTPLSLPAWHIVTRLSCLTFQVLRRLSRSNWDTYSRFNRLARTYGRWLVQGMQKTVEETPLDSPSKIDTHTFLWTFDSLDEDHELERFFSGLPGFRSSNVVKDPLPGLTEGRKAGLTTALIGLLNRTFSSDLLSESVKIRRAIICARAIDPGQIPWTSRIIHTILAKYQYRGPPTAEIVQIARGWINSSGWDEWAIMDAQATITMIIARVKKHDEHWFSLTSHSLRISEDVLRDYAAHGENLSLTILILITRYQLHNVGVSTASKIVDFSTDLEEASKFNVRDTLPELQHEFCALWNQIVRKWQNTSGYSLAGSILRPIRNVYLALHQGTDCAPTKFTLSTDDYNYILWDRLSYPVCEVPGHHSDSTHPNSPSITFAHAVSRDNSAPFRTSLASTSHAPPSIGPVPMHVDRNRVDAQLPDNNMSVSASFHPAHQSDMGSLRSPALRQTQAPLVQPRTLKPSQERGTSPRRNLRRSPHVPSQRAQPPH